MVVTYMKLKTEMKMNTRFYLLPVRDFMQSTSSC